MRRPNLWRFLVMRHPRLDDDAAASFDALLARTADGATIDYGLPQPKWWFLHHLTRSGWVLHGSNEPVIDQFRTRENFDAHNVRRVDGIWASDDAIWPLYFAVVNRPVAQSYINWCEHVAGTSRYLFSIGSDPREPSSWTTGTIYILSREKFRATPDTRELVSTVPVSPRARLRVEPRDFPFLDWTLGHRDGDTPRRVAVRHALSWRRPR